MHDDNCTPAWGQRVERAPHGGSCDQRRRIQEDTERDYIMTAEQGKAYGFIDEVIRKQA